MVNTISHRKFVKQPLTESSWKDIAPNFGIIKGLHLEYLEFPHKIKNNAPNIPDPTYSGKAYDDPEPSQPPPDSGPNPAQNSHDSGIFSTAEDSEVFERSTSGATKSSDDEDVFGANELDFLDTFGATPDKKNRDQINWEVEDEPKTEEKERIEQQRIPKFVNVAPPQQEEEEEEEEDPTDVYIREEVDRISNIKDLKKMASKGIDVGGEVRDDMDLQTTRIRLASAKKQVSTEKSISMNKFGLMGTFLAIDQGAGIMTDSMKGYFQYQMDIIDIYDDLLEEIGETQINAMIQEFDPTLKLGGMIGLTTAGYWLFQNYVGEDKVKGAKLLKQFLTSGQAKVLDEMTTASRKQKDQKEETGESINKEKKKKRRGPSYTANDVNAAI